MRDAPLVADVMTSDVVVATPDTRTADLAELIAALRLTAVPVTDADEHVVGVVAGRDLPLDDLLAAVRDRPSPPRWPWSRVSRRTVHEVMTTPAVTTVADATVVGAARLMIDRHVKMLPVLDHDERLVGVVTARDFLAVIARPGSVSFTS